MQGSECGIPHRDGKHLFAFSLHRRGALFLPPGMSGPPLPDSQTPGNDAQPGPDTFRQFSQVLAEELEAFGFSCEKKDRTLEEAHQLIRDLQADRSALCISGGGIRSASFALGVVQRLAEAGFLKKFDYLSTVSGGGYLGSEEHTSELQSRFGISYAV